MSYAQSLEILASPAQETVTEPYVSNRKLFRVSLEKGDVHAYGGHSEYEPRRRADHGHE